MMGQYATFMYSIGLLDEKQRAFFQQMTDKATMYIRGKKFNEAFKVTIVKRGGGPLLHVHIFVFGR